MYEEYVNKLKEACRKKKVESQGNMLRGEEQRIQDFLYCQ